MTYLVTMDQFVKGVADSHQEATVKILSLIESATFKHKFKLYKDAYQFEEVKHHPELAKKLYIPNDMVARVARGEAKSSFPYRYFDIKTGKEIKNFVEEY